MIVFETVAKRKLIILSIQFCPISATRIINSLNAAPLRTTMCETSNSLSKDESTQRAKILEVEKEKYKKIINSLISYSCADKIA